jgi:hypothetical protein
MRDITIMQAEDEVEVLDKISDDLSDTLRAGYDHLRANNPAVRRSGAGVSRVPYDERVDGSRRPQTWYVINRCRPPTFNPQNLPKPRQAAI